MSDQLHAQLAVETAPPRAAATHLSPLRTDLSTATTAGALFAAAAVTRIAVSGHSDTSVKSFIAFLVGAFIGAGAAYTFTGRRRSIKNPAPWPPNGVAITAAAATRRTIWSTALTVAIITAYVTLMPPDAMPGVIAVSIALASFSAADLRAVRHREQQTDVTLYRPARTWSAPLANTYKTIYAHVR